MKITFLSTRIATAVPSFPNRFILVILTLAGCALLPQAHAVNPPPDGGYANFNTAEGQNALFNLDTSTGFANTAVGSLSLQSDVDASFNTAVGAGTLSFNTGNQNTAVGAAALLLNTTGEANTAVGVDALLNNTAGEDNTAIGDSALLSNINGASNTAIGTMALFSNRTGSDNTATGENALASNTTGSNNTAIGVAALVTNSSGDSNTATGISALAGNIIGNNNTATGASALAMNTTGDDNTAIGAFALNNNLAPGNTAIGVSALFANSLGDGNTAVGRSALSNITDGRSNTALGENAGANLTTNEFNNIDIGFDVHGVAGEDNTIRIGNDNIADTFIRGISGATVASGATVLVAANGQLGTVTSSKRFKEEIKPMGNASEALFSLKPVTFRYRKEIDPAGTSQFGLVAEDVEKVNPDLVVRDENGKVSTVRYDQVNAMLLNEFLKEHRKVQELEETVARQQNDFQTKFETQGKQIAALATGPRKVSADLENCRPSRQPVLNNR